MDQTVAIAANFAARNFNPGRDADAEDEYYKTFGKDHFANLKSLWLKLRQALDRVSTRLHVFDVLVRSRA